jgi:hypothetical protein
MVMTEQMTLEQIEAVGRAISLVDFLEPCRRCARRQRMALARLVLREFTPQEQLAILGGASPGAEDDG